MNESDVAANSESYEAHRLPLSNLENGSESSAGLFETVKEQLDSATFELQTASAESARALAKALSNQINDHVIARLNSLDAPLLAVIGGSTGSGKSTLVNTLVQKEISKSSALRPTTRFPVLVHHPSESSWFEGTRILPTLARAKGSNQNPDSSTNRLYLVESESIPAGIALLDAPDIDSISDENRSLSRQLLRAADLWIFATTAHRYADAVPFELLKEAAQREIEIVILINRIPAEAGVGEELKAHLEQMLRENSISASRIFAIHENSNPKPNSYEIMAESEVEEIRAWIESLAKDATLRNQIAKNTLAGSLKKISGDINFLAQVAKEQNLVLKSLATATSNHFNQAKEEILNLTRDGALLRGEVLARWQDVLGTSDFIQGMQGFISRTRDRLSALVLGKPTPIVKAQVAIEHGLVSVIVDQCSLARSRTVASFEQQSAVAAMLGQRINSSSLESFLLETSPEFRTKVEKSIRGWQKEIFELVNNEGAKKRNTARILSTSLNAASVALMIVVFASTAFIPTGLEIGAGAATALVGQKVLESIFGDEAVRRLAKTARELLEIRINELVEIEAKDFYEVLELNQPAVSASDFESSAKMVAQLAAEFKA